MKSPYNALQFDKASVSASYNVLSIISKNLNKMADSSFASIIGPVGQQSTDG